MNSSLRAALLLLGGLSTLVCPRATQAQIDVTFPVSRMVVQRDNANSAVVQIAGSYAQSLDAVEARVVARAAGQGTSTNWTTIQTNPTNGQFNGTLTVQGGWYQVEVRGLRGGQVVATDQVDRFGVGEVFAIVGHSNAQGSSCYVNGTDYCPTSEGATDDRVTIVAVDQNTPEFNQYLNTADTRYLPGLAFSKLLTNSGMSPFAAVAWLWGRMGDVLVQRINVPVMIYNAGFGGTNMEHNYKAAYDIPFEHGFCKYSLRMPFVNLRNLMNMYVPVTGIRAVLLQHGENDRGNSTETILMHHYGVIDKSRQEFNKPKLAWIVSLSSFVSAPFENVRSAQRQVIGRANYETYQGPDLDNINTTGIGGERPDGIHYSPSGQRRAGEMWANAITSSMLQTITPYAAQPQPLADIACAGGNQLVLTQPGGYNLYVWNNGSTSRNVTVGSGTYSARLRNAQNQHVFPPAITVPATVRPATPTMNTDDNRTDICRSTGLTLSSSYDGLNQWSTGVTANTIRATTAGTYSLQAKHPVYGCLSDAVTKTVSLANADLSLSLYVSRRTLAVGDTVTVTLTTRNESECDAGQVVIQNRLPANVSFVSSADGLNAANGIVSGTLSSVPAGGTISRRYVARLTAPGAYQNEAELTASGNPDPDSTPNTGTIDGQDDASSADLRTLSADVASARYVSPPNPNQVTPPAPQSNQPQPDPNKADLSLNLQSDKRLVKVGEALTFTITIRNRGGLTATNVGVREELPAGLRFQSSANGLAGSGQIVSGTVSQVPSGSAVQVSFVATALTEGNYQTAAQISAAGQPDPNSIPNNGTTNGEDDTAQCDLRVIP